MKTKHIILISILTASLCINMKAQTNALYNSQDLKGDNYDARLLNHYTVEELNDLKINAPQDYAIFTYFLTQSYSLEMVPCNDCLFFNSAIFDISKYEYLRKKDETVIYDDPKHGFKLTVFAANSLQYITPQQEYLLTH